MVAEAAVWAALAEVQDPELPVGIVDLGLVRSVRVEGGTVRVGITFTSIACPCTDVLTDDVQARLGRLDGVTRVEVEELFEPWSRRDISGRGLARLREAGVA